MHTPFLFPHSLKRIGWVLFIPGLILGVLNMYHDFNLPFLDTGGNNPLGLFEFSDANLTNESAGTLIMCGLMLIAFSKRKQEDEFIGQLRLDALLWAVYANSLALLGCILFVYGEHFFAVLVYNMYTVPVIYLIRFQYLLRKASGINVTSE